MSLPLNEYVRRTVDSGLLSDVEMQEFMANLSGDRRPTDGEGLARQLVQANKLTAYQASAIYQGKGKLLVLGKYVILGRLGRGGMGIVYKAMHRTMRRPVAIKVLSSSAKLIPGAVQRFQREIRASGLLDHPNVVAAYDADEIDGRSFLAMQYVDGPDLATLVEERGLLSVSMALSCIVQAAHGLEYAHRRGLIHRDVKPKNLLLDRDGTVKLLDLGLVRFDQLESPEGGEQITETGQLLGSIDYMAPEQAADMRISDARSDIYGLGCTLWYLLTGKPPYEGAGRMQRLMAHWEQPVPSLREACPAVSEALERVFRKMVAKKPGDRYQTVTDVITDLERCRTAEVAAGIPRVRAEETRELHDFFDMLAGKPAVRERATEVLAVPPLGSLNASETSSLTKTDSVKARAPGTGETRSLTERPAPPARRLRVGLLAGAAAAVAVLIFSCLAMFDNDHEPRGPSPRPVINPPREAPDYKGGGSNIKSWKSSGAWEFKDHPVGGNGRGAWLVSEETFGDFELTLQVKIPKGGDCTIALGTSPDGPLRPAVLRIVDAAVAKASPGGPLVRRVQKVQPELWHQIVLRKVGPCIEASLTTLDPEKPEYTLVWLTEDGPLDVPGLGPSRGSRQSTPQVHVGIELLEASVEFNLFCVRDLETADDLATQTRKKEAE